MADIAVKHDRSTQGGGKGHRRKEGRKEGRKEE
jgi:hypothetical protein